MSIKRASTPAEVLKREQAKVAREKLELALAQQLDAYKIDHLNQYKFWPTRNWRFDFVVKPQEVHWNCAAKLAIEVQGGIYTGGRHTRGAAIEDECEKIAYAVMSGWRVMPVTAKQIKSGVAIDWIRRTLRMI